jgi:hypothetical protein
MEEKKSFTWVLYVLIYDNIKECVLSLIDARISKGHLIKVLVLEM